MTPRTRGRSMRLALLALLAFGLATAAPAAAGPIPPAPDVPLPDVPVPDAPLPDLPALSAGCIGAQVEAGTGGFAVDAPGCFVNDLAAPDPEPIGASFPAAPALPDLPALPLPA